VTVSRVHPRALDWRTGGGSQCQLGGGLLRAWARLRAGPLDRRLAAGDAAGDERLLAARAAVLAGRRERASVATGWQRVLARARDGKGVTFSSAIPVRRDAALIAEPAILALVARLRDDEPVAPAAIAKARIMLTDGDSAIYGPGSAEDLRTAVHEILAKIDRHGAS
jgi:hypothetical protein